ncbi:MAG: hypothetical protein HKO62_12940 [Gammaproteobacteria bacterium]|nr:hypothetical protein [Gammaproteobacteria bacterium]NNM01652.1 hypothetical protein [Gammaproteobacteria bacterium]
MVKAVRFLALAVLLLPAVVPAADGPEAGNALLVERIGEAFALGSGDLLYTEHHREQVDNGRVVASEVTYRDTSGASFAVKSLDFSANALAPDFRLDNGRAGHIEQANKNGDELKVAFKHPRRDELNEVVLPLPADAIIDAGFDRFIETHWAELKAGETLRRYFLVPSMQEFLRFRIRSTGQATIDGRRAEVIVLEPDSGLLRLLVTPIKTFYTSDKPSLLRYEGVSNMRGADGKNYKVRIDFGTQRTISASAQ